MVLLHATSGRGPEECAIALKGLIGVLQAEAEAAELEAVVLESTPTEHGVSSAIISLSGIVEDAFATSWAGSVQWICQSPVRPSHGRKRWFVGFRIMPTDEGEDQPVREADLSWDTMRASGPGGQHVNRTESAVRLTHKPTGITVTAQDERSQHRNRAVAIARLKQVMAARAADAAAKATQDRWDDHNALKRGDAIRTYEGTKFKPVGQIPQWLPPKPSEDDPLHWATHGVDGDDCCC